MKLYHQPDDQMERLADQSGENKLSIIAQTARLEMLLSLSSLPLSSIRHAKVASDVLAALDAAAYVIHQVRDGHPPESTILETRPGVQRNQFQPCADELALRVSSDRTPVNLPDLAESGSRPPPGGVFKSYLGVPMFDIDGRAVGVVAVFGEKAGGFSHEDEWCLKVVAQHCSAVNTFEVLRGKLALFEQMLAAPKDQLTQAGGAVPPAAAGNTQAGENGALASGMKGRILLVDDDRAVNSVIRRHLVKYGYQVDAVFDGLEALRTFEPAQHEVLVSDIQMPHMTGWELAKALKSREPKLSTIFITGYSNTVGMWNQTFLNQHGVVALLNKPLDFEYLSCIIEDQIRFRRR